MKKIFIVLSLIGLFVGCAQDNVMELEGRVAVKGSEPHTYLSIKDSKSQQSYKIQNQAKFDLEKKQNQTVKIKAVLIKEALGPGFPAVIEVVEAQ
ncbi:hypothetical protein MN086_04405 [Sulfurovum sp. XGS-02]|uniref:hypothetical protein n=1 Tax=Sulfurovum sp. XGS-02 TaxID=2925411 RepID=UPI00204EA623|nr:hypothetical protein [Sulfurovum sp. XGS-02]UPT78392.1 hypothetical protein MN086_04405 [Sulfurovum sp. XGS-02]